MLFFVRDDGSVGDGSPYLAACFVAVMFILLLLAIEWYYTLAMLWGAGVLACIYCVVRDAPTDARRLVQWLEPKFGYLWRGF